APEGTILLLEAHPAVHRFIRVPRGFKEGNYRVFWSLAWRARLGFALGRYRYDCAIYPPDDPEPLGSWIVAHLRAREKWINPGSTANQFDWQRQWLRRFATRVLQPRPGGGHELERNAFLASQWGCAIEAERPELPLSARALTYASVLVGQARHAVRRARAGGLIGIVPAGSAPINQYPPEKWAAVIRKLWEEHQLLPAVLCTPKETTLLSQISQIIGDVPWHRFPSDCDIAVAAAIVSRLDGLISVDTGLAHAATAFDRPTVVLATGGMPDRFWPWPGETRTILLTKPTACVGCGYRCTQTTPHCLTEISPQWIVDALLRAMNGRAIQPVAREYRHAG
ncbi:MAG: hypothetical protein NZ561_01060, partial [Phycisphaerae bacterium]|nr:hypothetical protein [Phycisphaerae bacterium]MDW8262979.1 glycosyltransferase family 9 protein [Phycisphaerales bacterium]